MASSAIYTQFVTNTRGVDGGRSPLEYEILDLFFQAQRPILGTCGLIYNPGVLPKKRDELSGAQKKTQNLASNYTLNTQISSQASICVRGKSLTRRGFAKTSES